MSLYDGLVIKLEKSPSSAFSSILSTALETLRPIGYIKIFSSPKDLYEATTDFSSLMML